MLVFTCLVVLFSSHFVYCEISEVICHSSCVCRKFSAICSGYNLTFIPRFPRLITAVTLQNTNLRYLGANRLINLTNNHILNLKLDNNSLKFIDPYVFRSFSNIIDLQISQEKRLDVNAVKRALHNMNTTYLRRLNFEFNGWPNVPVDMFKAFGKNRLKYLNLKGNTIEFINGSFFSTLIKLKRLHLEQNQIYKIITDGLPKIIWLNLANNQLMAIPNWCNSRMESNGPNLVHLNLGSNYITQLSNLKCISTLRQLNLERNLVSIIPSNAFSFVPNLNELNLRAVGNPLRKIEYNAFKLPSLTTLTISDCRMQLRLERPTKLSHIFKHVPNLQVLNMDNNILPNSVPSLNSLFRPLLKIRKLHLTACRLYTLPTGVFSTFKYLEELTLKSNRLKSWENGIEVFGNTSSIRHLDVQSNRINIVSRKLIPSQMLASLERFNLAYNPFYCTCDQKWFVDWLRHTNVTRDLYPKKYKCAQPSDLKNILLKNYKPTVDSCTPFDPLLTIIVSVFAFMFFVFSVVIIIFKCQANIKNFIYLCRVSRYRMLGNLPNHDSDDFKYHAFVVYCDADRLWVHENFVKRLEKEEAMRFCIHHRDFEAGETISGNIDTFLKKSWKVVVVMSNDFAKSEWCQWEVDIVLEKRRQFGPGVILPIMLKDITSKYMTSQLRTLLHSTPYLNYQQGLGEDIFWKAAKKTLRKSIGHPPIAVL